MTVADAEIVAYAPEHFDGVMAQFARERWLTPLEDPARAARALLAPGVITLVAVDRGEVVAVIQLQSDGEIQAHLSLITVAPTHRGQGLARRLITEAMHRSGATRLDLISIADDFYAAITNRRFTGFRITRADLGLS